MKIALQNVRVSELYSGFEDKGEEGICGFGGKLNIRPAYQREFIYKEKQRDAVIETVRKAFPLNTMYWAVSGDGYELMDGQQRTISICQYVSGDFPVEIDGSPRFFDNLTDDKKNQILEYELSIYVCDGTDDEKLDWFKIINIAGERLYDQELRNAIYTGPWLADAKRWFSKSAAPAAAIGSKLINGLPIRQEYLQTALDWISGGEIEHYMATHQNDKSADDLWQYFQDVLNWVNSTFPKYRKEMKGVKWGPLYNKFGLTLLDHETLEKRVALLMEDEEITKKSGIYDYVLTGSERSLSIRTFSDKMKREAYERQKGVCPVCKKVFSESEMEADHKKPWSKGGRTIASNCEMLCKPHNLLKAGA